MKTRRGNRYDSAIKEVFAGNEASLIEFFGGFNLGEVQPLNIEFNRLETRMPDLVLVGYMGPKRVAVHLEFQCRNEPKMQCRMLRYALGIYELYDIPVYQLVLYIGADAMHMKAGIVYDLEGFGELRYRYRLIDVGSLTRAQLCAGSIPQLYGLLPLSERQKRRKDPAAFLEGCISHILKSPFGIEAKRKCLLEAEIFAGMAFDEEDIERIFREAEDMLDLMESAGYRRIIEKGIEEGMKQGMKQGEVKTLQNNIVEVLKERFGRIKAILGKRIRQIDDAEVLRELLKKSIKVASIDEFQELLSAQELR